MEKVKGKFKLITLVVVLMTSSKVMAASNEYSDFKVLNSDATGLNLIYQVPAYDKSKVTMNNSSYDLIEIEKLPLLKDKGKPQLPVRIITLGIPPDANIEVSVSDFKFREISQINLAIADTLGENFEPSPKKELFPQNYSTSDRFYPQNLVEVEKIMWVRNVKVARLRIFPVQYNPLRNVVRYYSEISLKVNFVGPKAESYSQEKDSFDKIFQNMLLNFEQAKNWRKSQSVAQNYFSPNPLASINNCYKIITREDGLYKIDAPALQSAGIDVSQIDPRTIQIFNGGGKALPLSNFVPRPTLREMAIYVAGENDGVFNSSEYILFYCWSVNNWDYDSVNNQYNHYTNNYTTQNVYWLTWGGSFPNKRMNVKDGSLADSNPVMLNKTKARLHVENDGHLAVINGEIFDYSRWFWLTTQSTSLFLSLSGIITADTSRLKVNARFVPPTIIVNSDPAIITRTFGDTTEAKTASLIEGLNQIELNFSRVAYIDYYEVEYSSRTEVRDGQLFFESPDTSGVLQYNITGVTSTFSLLDITDLFAVKQITNYQLAGSNLSFQDTLLTNQKKRYYLVSDNKQKGPLSISAAIFANLKDTLSPSNAADFIVISHPSFLNNFSSLINLRQNQHRVKLVNVEDIYNEFAWGLFDPMAIRDFLKFAFENWSKPAPAWVLLVGDGTYDYRNLNGVGSVNYLPPLVLPGSVADDNYIYFGAYGFLDSDSSIGTDRGIDMVVGRWPVKTPAEVDIVSNKVFEYETNPEFGPWRNLITSIADDEFNRNPGALQDERFHTDDAEVLAKLHTPTSFNFNKVYLMEYPLDFNLKKPQAEEAVIKSFNDGSLIINYLGHGNPDVLAHEWVFRRTSDIARLTNKRRLPLIYIASCSIGFFDNPFSEGMGEEFLRTPDKGGVAVISATRPVYATPNKTLNYLVYDVLLPGDSLTVGEALYIAKFLRQPNFNDREFIYFGDPYLKLGRPKLKANFTSVVPDTLKALSRITVQGEVLDSVGNIKTDFNGTLFLQAFDAERKRTHLIEANQDKVNYTLPGNSIFRGTFPVETGQFQAQFIVPKDISYGGANAKISAYVYDQTTDGAGVRDSLNIAGSDTTVNDSSGPTIDIIFTNIPGFIDGDQIPQNSEAQIIISDSNGINITGELGHGITLSLNDNSSTTFDITSQFEYDLGNFQKGKVIFSLPNLTPGANFLKIKAWDNLNNSTIKKVTFQTAQAGEFQITELLNYPNPFSAQTNFTYKLTEEAEVEIKIYTLSGKLIRTIRNASGFADYNYNTIWDGKDQDGDQVASGVYIYKAVAKCKTSGNKKSEALGKAVVKR